MRIMSTPMKNALYRTAKSQSLPVMRPCWWAWTRHQAPSRMWPSATKGSPGV